MARKEKEEFDRVVEVQEAAKERDRLNALKRERENAEYRKELKDEMQRKETKKQMEPIVNLDEQKHMEELKNDYIMKLERIRQMKLETLRAEGVPEKYLVDLIRRKFDPK
jgi:hypothetical protein